MAHDNEAGRIKSTIDPRLADHVRRGALKVVDELKFLSGCAKEFRFSD
jgi:hypothetical protein